MSVSAKSAVAGIAMMSQVSKLAAAQMAITATAAGVLKGALALIGGPAGLAILAGMAIYKLVDSHDVAKRAAKDHAETLKKLQDELKATAQEATKFSAEQTKEALARLKAEGKKLGREKGSLNRKHKLDGKQEEIKRMLSQKISQNKIAKLFGVSRLTMNKYVRQHLKNG